MNRTIAISYDSVNSAAIIPFHSRPLFNDLMEIKAIRRKNMLALVAAYGTMEKLAETVGTSPSVLSQIKIGARNMGHELARRFEARLKKPEGWMDAPHNDKAVEEPLALYSVPASMQSRILTVFDWLTPEQQDEALKELEATAQANRSTAKIFGRRLSTANDNSVENAYGKSGTHHK